MKKEYKAYLAEHEKKSSLRNAIWFVLERTPANKEVAVKDVVTEALALHPLEGATPLATGSAMIYTACKAGDLNKGARGFVHGLKPVRAASTRKASGGSRKRATSQPVPA